MKFILLQLALFVTAILALSIPNSCEYAQCPVACTSRADSPAVGFDLSVDYGASAAYYENGSLHDGVRVDTSEEYKQMLKRLYNSRNEWQCHPSTIPRNMKERVLCRVARAKRWLNKKRGLPATPDVGIIADLLGTLHTATNSRLGFFVDRAVISQPALTHLVTEDIEEAAELTGLILQSPRDDVGRVTETSAAYAGSGYGLCEHYEDVSLCEDEEYYLPTHVAIRLTLTESALTGSCAWFQSAYFDFSGIDDFHFELGAGNFSQNPSEWTKEVQAAVFKIGSYCERFPDLLLVLGDHAKKPEFVEAVKAALRELLRSVTDPGLHTLAASDVLDAETETDYSTFLAARGAAEFARRASVGPSSRHGMDPFENRDRKLHDEAAPLPIRPLQHVLGGEDVAC